MMVIRSIEELRRELECLFAALLRDGESFQRVTVREILKRIGYSVLEVDEQSNPHEFEYVLRLCKDTVWKVASFLGFGDNQIVSFLLDELLPILQSNATQEFILECVPVCYCKPRKKSTELSKEIISPSEELIDRPLQTVVSSLQVILEANEKLLVKVLTTLFNIDSTSNTRALVFKLATDSLSGASLKDVPYLAELLLNIHFRNGLLEVINELDTIVIADESSENIQCIQKCLDQVWHCFPKDCDFSQIDSMYAPGRQLNEIDSCIIVLLVAKDPKFVQLGERNAEALLDIMQRLICLNPLGTYDSSFCLYHEFLNGTCNLLLSLLFKGYTSLKTLIKFCERHRSRSLLNAFLDVLHPRFYDRFLSTERDGREGTNLNHKLASYLSKEDFTENIAIEYQLIIDSFYVVPPDKCSILTDIAIMMQMYDQVEGILEIYMSWKPYLNFFQNYDHFDFFITLASIVVAQQTKESVLHIVKELIKESDTAILGVFLLKHIRPPNDIVLILSQKLRCQIPFASKSESTLCFCLESLRTLMVHGYNYACLNILIESRVVSEFVSDKGFYVLSVAGEVSSGKKFVLNIANIGEFDPNILGLLPLSCSVICSVGEAVVLLNESDWSLVNLRAEYRHNDLPLSGEYARELVKYFVIQSFGRTAASLKSFYKIYQLIHHDSLARKIYSEYNCMSFLWRTMSSECSKIDTNMCNRLYCIQVLRHINNIVRYSCKTRYLLLDSHQDFSAMIDFKSVALLIHCTEAISKSVLILRKDHPDTDVLQTELEMLGCMYELILTVLVVTKSWDKNILLNETNFSDECKKYLNVVSNEPSENGLSGYLFQFFKIQVDNSFSAQLASLLIDILGAIGMTYSKRLSILCKSVLQRIYPCDSNNKIIHRNVLLLIALDSEKNRDKEGKSFRESDLKRFCLELARNYNLEHAWLRSIMLQCWSTCSNRTSLLYGWISNAKEVIGAFGRKPLAQSSLPLLTFANFPTFYSTTCILIRLTLVLWKPEKGLDSNDTFLQSNLLFFLYTTALELFANNSKKFPRLFMKNTIKHALDFVSIVEQKIECSVKWRSQLSENLNQPRKIVGSMAMFRTYLYNCASTINATRNFVALSIRNGNENKDDGIESDNCSDISALLSLDRNCQTIIEYVKSTCFQHNLSSPAAGNIEINVPIEGLACDSIRDCDEGEDDNDTQIPSLENEMEYYRNSNITKNNKTDDDGYGIEGNGWG